MNDNARKLYDALSQEYDLGTFEQFNSDIQDESKRRKLYDATINEYNFGEYDSFNKQLGFGGESMAVAQPKAEEVKPVGQLAEKETLTTFGEGVEQGAESLYQGGKYAFGETARIYGDSQRVYSDALKYLDEQGGGFDAKSFDVKDAIEADRYKRYEKAMDDWRSQKAKRKAEREEMGFFEGLKHKWDDPSMPDYKDYIGSRFEDIRAGKAIVAVDEALKEAGGDINKAKVILEDKSKVESWGDKATREAGEALSQMKPVEGAAWWGQMVPQVAGQATAIASNLVPYVGGFLGKALSYGTTAGLTASSAGQAMAEARQAGASDDEVWSAGVAQALIEYGSEKIPLDRLIGKTGSAAFKKGYKAVAGNIPEKELEKLLVEGNKKLGGKLLSGKTAKELIKDMGVEGASEFVAEFLGTYVPVIYADKESYPTLLEAVKNGWEGAKAGFAMGGFLGGGSMVLTNRANNERRKMQGGVTLAETKDYGVVEVLRTKDDMTEVLLPDGNTEWVPLNELTKTHTYSIEAWKTGDMNAKAQAAEEVYNEGYNTDEQEWTKVKTVYDFNRAMAEEHLGDVFEQLDKDPIATLQSMQESFPDEDMQIARDYVEAKARFEGVSDNVKDNVEQESQESDKVIQERINKTDGMVYSTTLHGGERVFITGGTVVLDDEGYIDVANSGDLWALYPDGTKKQLREGDLREKVEAFNTDELKATERAMIEELWRDKLNTFSYSDNEGEHVITVKQTNGEISRAVVDGVEQDVPTRFINELKDKIVQKSPAADNTAEVATETPAAGNTQTMIEPIPTETRGKVKRTAYHVVPIERTLEDLESNELTEDEKIQFAQANIDEINSELQKVLKQEPKMGADIQAYKAAKAQWTVARDEWQKRLDYYNELLNRLKQPVQTSEVAPAVETPQATNKMQPVRKVVSKKKAAPEMSETVEEFVASVMPKITPESFKRETGLSNGEQRQLVGYIAGKGKGGITIEQAAESIVANYNDELLGLGFTGDEQDVRDMIINILSNGNPKGYIKRSRALREAELSQQEREMADVWAEGMGFDSYENYLDYTESLLEDIEEQRKGFDETEYYNNLAGNYGYDTTGERKDFGRGGELLQGEQFVTTTPSEVIGEGYEGTAVPGDVRGGGDNALTQGETRQVNTVNDESVAEGGNNSVPLQQTSVNNLNENNDGKEITTADNSGAQPGREELPDTEQVGAGVPIQDTARNSKRKRRNAGVGSSELGNGLQYDVNRNYTNEEIETIVSSVTDIVDGKVVITGEVTDGIKAIVRGYESGGIAKKGRGILDEYYTDGKIVDAVNLLIAPYFNSSTPIRVLEPSVGIGNFIQAVNNITTSEVVAFEINETTARIAKILYPDVDVNLRSFETEFIDENGNKKPLPQKYSLVIGNPPYGSHRGLYKGLGEESKIARYEDYFVKRSLDVLNEGGVLAMVLPSSWIDRHTKFGGYTIERAYRLPSGAFEATQVGTDIVILKKDSSVPITEHVPYFEQFPERVLGEIKERTGRYGRTEEFVEGDIDAAIEAIKKENAEQVADLLDIEKSNDALNNIESAIDETGGPEKAVDVVKDAQNSEKADNKPATKLSGKQDKYKVELNRGAETVPTSSQFTHEFSEGEVEAFADTDYEGTLSNPTKHKRYANYIGGSAVHDFYYAEGDIYSKLALLEQDKRYIVDKYGVEQYEKQKALLEGVLPKQKSLDEITISPNTAFVKNLNILTDGERVSLKDMFVDFCRKLPYQAFGSSSAWEVIGYVNNEQVHGTDKQRNQLVRERRKRAANDLFNKFLNEELSDNAKKQVVAAFNREYNSTYRPDYSKVPMFSTINRDFKGKPLKLTSVQLAGIGRMTVKGVGVLAHEVGFGKTLSGILAMHEAMTRGFAKKPLIVVPNDNILKQWVETIGEVLPSATVNTLGNLGAGYDLTDFKVNDREFTIITYEGLKAMSFSDGTYNHLASKFSYITEDLNKHQSERDIQKDIEKKNELKGKMKRGTKSSYMFEDFGFDWLTVDEVHNANHIVSKVRLDKSVASDFRSQSQRTSDLGLKTWLAAQYIQEENNGRNVLLLSATPFTNKPLEYYSVLSLVGNDMLERKGFFNVDQFFATFMEADNELEIGANGRPVQKTNVRRFRNNGLFQQLLSEFIDIKGEEDNPELVRPERLNKEYKIAQNELTTEAMAAAQELLSDNDTVLQGISHARAAAFSPYATSLLDMQPKNHKEFVKNSPKIDATIKMIEQNIKDRPDAGQIIYSEVGVEYFPLIRDYLVKESGLKPSEVRIITGATSNNERVNIQSAFNNGEVKVVVGSPAIKEGLNLQGNTTDMYILSLPWNFTQLRQIEGRGWRQGNKWENIRINYMLTNDSVDVFMLQRLQLKQGLYNEAMKSGAESLDVSDIDTAELKTALITDPAVRAEIVTVQERAKLQQEKTQIEADLSFVMRKYEAYNKLVSKLESQKNTIKMYREWAKKGDEYWAQRVEREEAQLTSIENEIEEEKQNLIKKGVNVDDIVRQTQQSQNDIAAIQEKIDNLKEFQEELTQKFREESEAKTKEQGDLVSTYIKERKAENKGGFYKIRPVKSENKAVEEEDDTLYREDDKISYDEAVFIAEEFVRTHKGAAKKVVISKGYEFVEQQMRNAGFSEVSIEAFKKNNAKGKRTTAAYYPDSDGIVIFKTGDKSSFMDSIWHENSHRVLDKYIKNPGLLKIRFDELPVKYKDIIIKLLEGNYEEYQYPEEAMCMFIGGLYKNTPYLKNGKYNITRDFITFEKEYRRFVDFAQNVIDNIYYGRETEFDGDGPSGVNGRQGEWNSTHQRNSGRERDGGANKERTEVVNREGEGLLTDREVVMDSDPYSKALGRPRYTGKKMGEYVARQRMEMAKRVKALAQKLNLNIDVLESTEGLSGKRAKAKGWYEPKGKRIVVVIPNHSSVNDAVATVLHEAVAHHGLRELFGENFDTFLQNVYNNADADVREAIETLAAQRYNGNLLTATEEYLASLAENTDFEYAAKSGWWEKIKDYFFKMLRGLGIEGFDGITLTDNELRYILWRSYQNLANPGMYNNVFAQAKDTALQYELKVGNYAPDALNGSMVAGEDITPEMKEGDRLFREGETATQKEKQNILKENARELRRLHNVSARYPITALRNLRHALETEQERLEHDRLFAVRDGLVDDADMPVSIEVNPQGMTLQERITESLLKLANDNRENVETRLAAIRAYSGSLDNVLKLMRAQKGYDKKTVDMFVGLVKMYLRNNAVKGMSNYDIYRLLGLINRASGGYRMRVDRAAEQIVEIITKGHVRELQETMNRMLKTGAEKVNASGVVVQGGVDIVGKRKLNSFRDAIVMSQEAFEEKMAKIQEKVAKIQEKVAKIQEKVAKNPEDAEVLAELDAMYLAQQYKEKVADSKADEEELLRQVAADSEMRGLLNRGVISRKTYNEFADGVRRNVIELRTRRIDEMQKILRALAGDISEGMLAAKEFRDRELAKRMEIHDIAEADLKGVSKAAFKSQKASKAMDWFVYKNPIVRGVMAGLPTYNNLLSLFGEKTAGMTGNLKEYFLSKYTTAVQEKWKNLQKDKETLEEKTKRITGSSFEELGDLSAKIGATISFWDGEAVRERELSYGQMMYIYMVNKMTDGAMKLRSMGISEEMVNTIEGMLPKKLVEMADWIQGDFLPQMRGRFNVVHQRMFGASMDEVENYFPLVINKGSRRENVDVSSMIPTTPSTITGSIIKRRVNTAAIDINANALDVLMRHLEEMEQWAAFGEFIKDNNILLSDTDFKNRVKNMKSVRYGDGEDILEAFKECAQLATGTHRAKGNELSVNLARGLNSGKIAFGFYTALKQLLSQPAVLADAGVMDVVKAVTSPFEAWEWAAENVPGFEERWKGRTAGIETFEKTDKDWGLWDNRTMKKIRNLGMTPNAWVDAAVVAVNAKAVYDSRMKFYSSIGFDKAVANKRALHDAAVSYNETQQSGLGAFVSPMQADRTFLGMLLTLFRNSQMGYQRRLINAVKGIANRVNVYDELRANTVEKYKKMGLDDKKADEAAQRDMNVSLAKDAMSVVLFGYVLNLLWALGEDAIYLLFGDDEEEKDRVMKENAVVAFSGLFEGLTLGGQAKEVMTRLYRGENVRDLGILTTPLETDWNKVFQKFQSEGWLSGAYQLVMTSTESLTGVSPQRLVDIYAAVVDLCKGDLEMSRRVMLFATRLMMVPQSQIDKVYQDWATGEDDEELLKMAKRYVDYKMNRENPLDKDNPELRLKKLNRFDEAVMERITAGVESAQDIELVYDRVSPKYKDKLRRMWNSLTDEEAKDSATVNAELVDDFEKKMRGLVDFKVYDSLETMDDLRDDRFLKEVEAMGMPANTKKKNGGVLSDEELRLLRLYKIASKTRSSVNELKRLMDKRPEDAEKAMMRVRMLRAKAMNLIEGYNE